MNKKFQKENKLNRKICELRKKKFNTEKKMNFEKNVKRDERGNESMKSFTREAFRIFVKRVALLVTEEKGLSDRSVIHMCNMARHLIAEN